MGRVVKNYFYNLSYQILLMVLPIITTPYVSRILHPEGIGKYNYTFSIISVTLIISQLGTNMYGQREIAYVQDNKRERSNVFWNIWFVRFLTTLIVLPIYICISFSMKQYSSLMIAMTIYLVANIVDCSWYFQGLEEFRKTAIRSIVSKVLGVLLVFALVKRPEDIELYAVIIGSTQLMGNIALLPYLKNSIYGIKSCQIDIKKHFVPILELFLPTAAVYVYTYIDKIILGILSNDVEVGFYSQSEKIIKLLMTLVTSLGIVLLPHIATAVQDRDFTKIRREISQGTTFVFFLGTPLMTGCLVIGNRFIPWFLGDGFEPSVTLFKLLSPLIVIIGIASIIGQAVLIPLKKQGRYTISIAAGALINLLLNILLIPSLGATGAAIGTLVAELTVTTIQFISVVKYVELDVINMINDNWHYIPLCMLMGITGGILDLLLPGGLLIMLLIIVVCVLVYFGALLVINDKYLFYIKMKIFGGR